MTMIIIMMTIQREDNQEVMMTIQREDNQVDDKTKYFTYMAGHMLQSELQIDIDVEYNQVLF